MKHPCVFDTISVKILYKANIQSVFYLTFFTSYCASEMTGRLQKGHCFPMFTEVKQISALFGLSKLKTKLIFNENIWSTHVLPVESHEMTFFALYNYKTDLTSQSFLRAAPHYSLKKTVLCKTLKSLVDINLIIFFLFSPVTTNCYAGKTV